MTTDTRIPAFAVLGHPNEGKSSVVSTLAEDDRVPISPIPGETRKCREYPVMVDGKEIIRFIDTPGFQQPRQTLRWMQAYTEDTQRIIDAFIAGHAHDPDFEDDCELSKPLAQGAGIIYVVDGSRPLRNTDVDEMEILRMTGLPRMAVINIKEKEETSFLNDWRSEALRHFNTIRIFDAHQATYVERMDLLESLKRIDPAWQPALARVISAFQQDWEQRLKDTAAVILELIDAVLGHGVQKTCRDPDQIKAVSKQLFDQFQEDISRMEGSAHQKIRKRFKHNIFHRALPARSILNEDLFSEKSWRVLGMTRWQLAAAAGAGGGALGAKIDLALAGHSLGVFTALGGLIGVGSALMGAREAASISVKGLPIGSVRIRVGAAKNDQLLYILIDRGLVYASHAMNWAHSRRDQTPSEKIKASTGKAGFTSQWELSHKKLFARYFQAARKKDALKKEQIRPDALRLLTDILQKISTSAQTVL